jgi:hypothetical protein
MSLTPMAPSCTGVIVSAFAMVTLVAIVGIVAMVIVKTQPTASEQAPCQPVCTVVKPNNRCMQHQTIPQERKP